MKLSELIAKQKDRFRQFDIPLDRFLIERRRCPRCRGPVKYRGVSNQTEYRAYGTCQVCNYAGRFWRESIAFTTTKLAFSKKDTA